MGMAVYFFYGEEDFNIEAELNKLKNSLDKNFLEMSYKVYDNPKFTDLISILRTQSMMFGKMLAVIKCLDYFSKSFEDKEIKEITQALENNTDGLDVVFLAQLPRGEGKKLDARKKFYKLLSKFNSKEFPIIPNYKTAELENFVKKQAQKKKIKISQDAVKQLIEQIGNNLRQLDGELDKLLLVAGTDVVNAEMVKENCFSNEDLFAFAKYLMLGQKGKALKEYRALLEKKYVLEVLAPLQTMLRQWIILKAKSSKMSSFELAKEVGWNEFRVQKTLPDIKNVNLKNLVKLKENLTDVEYKIKSGQSLNPESDIENVIFK